jgi:hypothetical protein
MLCTEKNNAWRTVILSSSMVVLFCLLLNILLMEGFFHAGMALLYFLGFTVLPCSLYALQHYGKFFTKSGDVTASGWTALCLNALFCVWILSDLSLNSLLSGAFYIVVAYFFLLVLGAALFRNRNTSISLTPRIELMASAAVLGIALWGFINTFVVSLWGDFCNGLVLNIPNFGWPLIFAAVLSIAVIAYILSRQEQTAKWVWLVYFTPILLFNIQGTFELDHYNAFVGPAIAVLHGKIPLIDIFCQYGLGYLIFTLAFLVLPNTYTVCTAIVSMMNIFAFILYLLMLRMFIKNAYQFALVGIVSILGVYFSTEQSMNLFPSSLGFRYLPAMLFTYCLVRPQEGGGDRLSHPLSRGLLFLNALWSLESLLFYFLIAGFYCWLNTRSFKAIAKTMLRLLFILFLGFLVFFVLYFICFKQFPNYAVYLEYPLHYLNGIHDQGSFTKNIEIFSERYLFFFPMAIVSLLLFYFSIFDFKKWNNLFLVNFAGIVFFVYVAVHSFVFHIKTEWVLFLPSFFGALFFVLYKAKNAIFKFLSGAVIGMTCFVFLFVFVVKVFYTAPFNTGSNDALVYHLIHFKKEVFENYWYNLNHFCNKKNYRQDNSDRIFFTSMPTACQKYNFHDDVQHVINKYYKNTTEVMLFSASMVEILFENNKYNPLMNNPSTDASIDLIQKILLKKNFSAVKEGKIIIVDKSIDLEPFQSYLLRLLWKKFGFEKIDETPNIWVFKIVKKENQDAPWFLRNNQFSTAFGKNGVLFRKPFFYPDLNMRDLYGEAVTIEMDFHQPFLMTGLRLWNLLNALDSIYYRKIVNNAVRNFNVLVSLDGKKWNMVVSEENYFMDDKKYYYRTVPPQMVKKVRLNAMVDSPNLVVGNLDIL